LVIGGKFTRNDRTCTSPNTIALSHPKKRSPLLIPKRDRTSPHPKKRSKLSSSLTNDRHLHIPKNDRTSTLSKNDRTSTSHKKTIAPHILKRDRTSHIPKSDRTSKILIIKKRSHLQNPHYQSDRTSTSPKMIAHSLSFSKVIAIRFSPFLKSDYHSLNYEKVIALFSLAYL
jgi:hypothetical protein